MERVARGEAVETVDTAAVDADKEIARARGFRLIARQIDGAAMYRSKDEENAPIELTGGQDAAVPTPR